MIVTDESQCIYILTYVKLTKRFLTSLLIMQQ